MSQFYYKPTLIKKTRYAPPLPVVRADYDGNDGGSVKLNDTQPCGKELLRKFGRVLCNHVGDGTGQRANGYAVYKIGSPIINGKTVNELVSYPDFIKVRYTRSRHDSNKAKFYIFQEGLDDPIWWSDSWQSI